MLNLTAFEKIFVQKNGIFHFATKIVDTFSCIPDLTGLFFANFALPFKSGNHFIKKTCQVYRK